MTGDPWSFGVSASTFSSPTYCTCPTYWLGIYPPPPCDYCKMNTWRGSTSTTFVTAPQPLSESDVERIAKRVAELLKGDK